MGKQPTSPINQRVLVGLALPQINLCRFSFETMEMFKGHVREFDQEGVSTAYMYVISSLDLTLQDPNITGLGAGEVPFHYGYRAP